MASGMSSSNFSVIFGWMLNEMNLSGNELLVYSVIYGFSQDGETHFKGGRAYLANTLNISKPTVDKALRSLREKGYIIRTSVIINGVEFVEYHADLEIVKNLYREERNFTGGSKETLPPSKETLPGGSKETLPSNKDTRNNRETNKGNKYIEQEVLSSVPEISGNTDLYEAFIAFIEMRRKIKRPMTERALKILINKCFELSSGRPDMMVKILDRSICHCWQDVYPYEDDSARNRRPVATAATNPFTEMKKSEGMI